MRRKCNGCADKHTYFRDPPCRTCRHEHADGTEVNFRPWIEQEAAHALLAACEWLTDKMDHGDGHIWCEIRKLDGSSEWVKRWQKAIADAKGEADETTPSD